MNTFNLEDRYIVIKRSDMKEAGLNSIWIEEFEMRVDYIGMMRKVRGKQPLQALVIEKDWPEYEAALKMLRDRVEQIAPPRPTHYEGFADANGRRLVYWRIGQGPHPMATPENCPNLKWASIRGNS